MNKKAFTLIELLAVIIILSIILVIAVPKILDIISDANIQTYISNNKMMIKATETYMTTNIDKLPINIGDTYEVKLSDLQASKLIKEIKDPKNRSSICNGYILVTKVDNDIYDYSPYLNCEDEVIADSYINDGLIGNWKLNNNAYDYSLSNKHGTIYNVTAATDRFGIENKTLNFSGINTTDASRIDTSLSYERNMEYTISVWVYRKSSRHFQFIVGGRFGNNIAMGIITFDSERYALHTYDTTDKHIVISSLGSLKLNKWTHLVVAVKYTSMISNVVSGEATLYSNGEIVGNNTFSNVLTNNCSMSIGSPVSNSADRAFEGMIDDVTIYNRILSSDEIKYKYNIEKAMS